MFDVTNICNERHLLNVETINIIFYYSYCKLIKKTSSHTIQHSTQVFILHKFFLSHQHFALDYIMSIINH